MKAPRAINPVLQALLFAVLILSVFEAVATHEHYRLLWGLAVLALFGVLWVVAAFINVIVFPPIFRLLARFTGRLDRREWEAKRKTPRA